MTDPTTFLALLDKRPAASPALGGAGRRDATSGDLAALARRTIETLNGLGIGRGDRVALVLPNGPEMAAAFLAIGAGATTCPLNPAYRAEEYRFYLEDLKAKAIVLPADTAQLPLARQVAAELGLLVLALTPHPDFAGAFALTVAERGRMALALRQGSPAEPGDVALILHTSGTTSRPKIVPLTQANLLASAHNIAATLRLSPADRCLNIMPLFHIHGLVGATLSSMAGGGSLYATPGFNALRFMAELAEARPSWYSAVPTMHQAILARGERQPEAARAARLRFIRSSSSSLPPQVMAGLEALFGCPVIESYGMTEASHQMTSNQLPPGKRKAGSVGPAAGPEVALLLVSGQVTREPGVEGEVVISGPSVTLGYESNEQANAESFFFEGGLPCRGQPLPWFRTGDEGRFDADGFLTITGRLKEIINRGGEKVSPREIDEAALDHPAVAEVCTFALPHDKLGEEVACCVVLREGTSATEQELRSFLAARLADFKVPRKVLLLEAIPKGATGKVQRIGMAQRLGLA
ncbi:MAG TPA: acyl--CoA ligase [Kiloniellales bacterium]|nr:acyl--CoA ligase [Kiloniellales bacterium]